MIVIEIPGAHPRRVGKLRKILKEERLEFTNMGVGISNVGGCFVHSSTLSKVSSVLRKHNLKGYRIYEY